MKSGKGHQDEEEFDDDEFGTKKDASTSVNNTKDGKNNDKANAVRSKHSVTEQKRRSKINERFQILRDLIPDSDQKRDTASFLLEVIQYVQFLHEKVQKYEGPYQPWDSDPTKLMPWRNSHWRGQSLGGLAQGMKNGSGPVSAFHGQFDESSVGVAPTNQTGHMESDSIRSVDPQHTAMPVLGSMPVAIDGTFSQTMNGQQASEVQSTECPSSSNHHDELAVEGGTISISSVYSQGLLNSLAQALESTGVDLSQASISVQINLGKRANGRPTQDHGNLSNQPVGTFHDSEKNEDLGKAHKRQKF